MAAVWIVIGALAAIGLIVWGIHYEFKNTKW